MRMNLPVTEHERTFPGDQRLISTTDLDSRITYCNDAFVAISGFTYDELVGQPHNLVRHPDMPMRRCLAICGKPSSRANPGWASSKTGRRTAITIG